MKNGLIAIVGNKKNLNQSVMLIILIFVLCVIATTVNPRFVSLRNIINIFQQISVLGIIACGIGYNYLKEAFDGEPCPHPVLKLSQYPFSQGEPGSM